MKYILAIFIITLTAGCAWFGAPSDSQITTISAPPQKLNESNEAMPIVTPNKASASATKANIEQRRAQQQNTPRIEEDRENGVVNQIKVNNKDLPSYYIYPTQQQNYNFNNIPNQNVSPPNWQISW